MLTEDIYECPINDDFNPSTQLNYLDKIRFDHQKRIEAEATEEYIKEFLLTNEANARNAYFRHLNLYL